MGKRLLSRARQRLLAERAHKKGPVLAKVFEYAWVVIPFGVVVWFILEVVK